MARALKGFIIASSNKSILFEFVEQTADFDPRFFFCGNFIEALAGVGDPERR